MPGLLEPPARCGELGSHATAIESGSAESNAAERDGDRWVEDPVANRLSGSSQALEAIAAGHAENRNWAEAIKQQQTAIRSDRHVLTQHRGFDQADVARMQRQLDLYTRHRPFRLDAVTPQPVTAPSGNRRPSAKPVPAAPPRPKVERRLKVAVSSLGYVNVRREPNEASPVVGRVKSGEMLRFSAVSKGWYKIDNKGGWIAGKYVIVQ